MEKYAGSETVSYVRSDFQRIFSSDTVHTDAINFNRGNLYLYH